MNFSGYFWQVKVEGRKGYRFWLINSKGEVGLFKDYKKFQEDVIFVMIGKIRVVVKKNLSCRVLWKLIKKI